jgi:hypothetical protein
VSPGTLAHASRLSLVLVTPSLTPSRTTTGAQQMPAADVASPRSEPARPSSADPEPRRSQLVARLREARVTA